MGEGKVQCPKCGFVCSDNVKFCAGCGSTFTAIKGASPSMSKKLSFGSDGDTILKNLRPILPSSIATEFSKALKADDDAAAESILDEKIRPALEDYQSKVLNPKMNDGEDVLWSNAIKKGIVGRHVSEKWLITNLRAARFNYDDDGQFKSMTAVGHKLSTVTVINSHRVSKSTHSGGAVRVKNIYLGSGSGRSDSKTYGDLAFIIAGKEVLRFTNLEDPNGIKRMIEAFKK